MANMFDYLKWRGDLDFSAAVLNPVDYVIFSQLSYLPFDGIVPPPGEGEGVSIYIAAKKLEQRLKEAKEAESAGFIFDEDPDLIKALADSNRFRNCHLLGFVNQIDIKREIQFSALCIYTGDGLCTAVFRGTDASFIGWKEDFNMSFMDVIPAQEEAVNYIEKIAGLTGCPLRICGHSKGGNLAVYAAAYCDKKIQSRIREIISLDSPGFHPDIINSEGHRAIREKIRSFVPQSSIIGMLLEHGCSYKVVKSSQTGLMQHSLFSWEVTHNDFEYVDRISQSSVFIDKTIRSWIGGLNNDQKEIFFSTVYDIFKKTEAKSLLELEKSWLISIGRLLRSFGSIDRKTRKAIMLTIAELFISAGKNIDTLLQPDKHESRPDPRAPLTDSFAHE